MTSTLETPGPFDALEKARPDEPHFMLLARDHAAPGAVTEWARIRRDQAHKLYGESTSPRDMEFYAAELRQCAEAEEIALSMPEWREREAPAESHAGRSSYNEGARAAEETIEADRRKRVAYSVRHLREAAYHLSEARDALTDLDLIGEAAAADVAVMLQAINDLAEAHTPKRAEFAAQPGLPLGEGVS